MKKRKRVISLAVALATIFVLVPMNVATATETWPINWSRTSTGTIGAPVPYSMHASGAVEVIKGEAFFSETSAGSHYYAFSEQSSTYTEAFVNIVLPTSFDNKGRRNGYISLGVMGTNYGIDIGLKNDGTGWRPYSWDRNLAWEEYTDYMAPATATNAIMGVRPTGTDSVLVYIQFKNASNVNVGNEFSKTIKTGAGFQKSGDRYICRFYRFASLVPKLGMTDNRYDGSYMRGGKFTNCQLYDGSKYHCWGITSTPMVDVWKVYPNQIALTWTQYNDIFNINHS